MSRVARVGIQSHPVAPILDGEPGAVNPLVPGRHPAGRRSWPAASEISLVALFLPLAAWILASRRGEWERLLAATLATVLLAVPTLVVSATWEVYIAPHVLATMFGPG